MNPQEPPDRSRSISSTMLAGVKLRRPEAWNRLVDVWVPIVYGWCRRRGIQDNDAADIVQDVLIRVWQNARHFERGTFRGWVSTITRNTIADHFRDARRHPKARGGSSAIQFLVDQPEPEHVDIREDPDGPSGADCDSLIVRQVLKVIRGDFEEHTFQAFWRTTVDGLSAAEAAEELAVTVDAVRQAKCRVLKRLREELEAMGICVTPPRCT